MEWIYVIAKHSCPCAQNYRKYLSVLYVGTVCTGPSEKRLLPIYSQSRCMHYFLLFFQVGIRCYNPFVFCMKNIMFPLYSDKEYNLFASR